MAKPKSKTTAGRNMAVKLEITVTKREPNETEDLSSLFLLVHIL